MKAKACGDLGRRVGSEAIQPQTGFPSNRIRVLAPLGWLVFPIRLPAVVVIGFWIALQFFDELVSITGHNAQTLNGGVAYMAHIGGFLTGLALSFFWQRKEGIETGDMKYYRPE